MGSSREEAWIAHVRSKHPELANEPFRTISSGHQNLIFVVGEQLIFRFPLTSDLSSLKLEQKLLPKLAKRLPLPIPNLLYQSAPSDKIQYIGYPFVPGQSLEGQRLAAMDQATKLRIAKQLAGFLTALHTFSYEPITKVNTSQFQDEWRKNWSGYYRAVESTVFPHIGRREKIWIMNLFYDYLYPIEHFKFQPCLIHGDFKNDHILFDPKEQKLTGIIDFGQMRMGDPSYDYHDLCITYGGKFAALVLNHYKGPNDKTFLRRCSGFYEHLLSLSSMINALQTGNKDKFNLRHEWLKQKAKQAE